METSRSRFGGRPNQNMVPTKTTTTSHTYTNRHGEVIAYDRNELTFQISLGGETREVAFYQCESDDSADNSTDFVCRIGAGEKLHSCYARIWRQEDGTWRLNLQTTALNRSAMIVAFKEEIVWQHVKSQHVGSKVN
jgi:hypothetical protein